MRVAANRKGGLVFERLVGPERLVIGPLKCFCLVRREKIVIGLAEDILTRAPLEAAQSIVGRDEAMTLVLHRHQARHCVEQIGEVLVRLGDLLLGLFLRRNIAADTAVALEVAGGIENRRPGH